MKRGRAFLVGLLIILLAATLRVEASADLFAFSSETDLVLDSFAAEYGWVRERISASDWIGTDGTTQYSRAAGHQKEYYEDLFQGSREYCVEHNLIKISSMVAACMATPPR